METALERERRERKEQRERQARERLRKREHAEAWPFCYVCEKYVEGLEKLVLEAMDSLVPGSKVDHWARITLCEPCYESNPHLYVGLKWYQPLRRPVAESTTAAVARSRSALLKGQCLAAAKGRCGFCGEAPVYVGRDGAPRLQVHHLVPLAEGGEDVLTNLVALCPNCHDAVHHGAGSARISPTASATTPDHARAERQSKAERLRAFCQERGFGIPWPEEKSEGLRIMEPGESRRWQTARREAAARVGRKLS